MMKKEMCKLLTTAGLMTMLFGGTALAAGWTYTTSGKQVYQQDDGSIAKNTWIKAEDNGNTIWYYATNDGSLKNRWLADHQRLQILLRFRRRDADRLG